MNTRLLELIPSLISACLLLAFAFSGVTSVVLAEDRPHVLWITAEDRNTTA